MNNRSNQLDPIPDNTLMMQVKNGDLDKLGLLFERYHMRLYGFFYRLTYRREISEDLVQGVFERILKYRSSYTGSGEFAVWIFSIARNHHSDYHRGSEKEPLENRDGYSDMLSNEESENQLDQRINGNEFEDDAVNENRWLVRQALDRLDPDKKKILVLSRYEGFRYREIAGIMGCSESAVKVRVFRALNEMKEIITRLREQEKL